MIVCVDHRDGVVVAQVVKRTIDASNAESFKADMVSAMAAARDGVILDLTEVDFVDSAGLGAIVGVYKKYGTRGMFTIVGVSTGVERVFRLTRMDKIFEIRPSVEEALQSVVPA